MDVDEFAHALGIVFCPPFGELDLAPGTMHVEDHEEIDGAVAAILVNRNIRAGPARPGLAGAPRR